MKNIHLISGANTDISAGQSLTAHAAESVNLFAQSSGIKVQANQGKVEVQAQNDELQLNALKDATLTSEFGENHHCGEGRGPDYLQRGLYQAE